MMPFVRWTKGGEADVIGIDDDKVTLASTISSAPGSRLEGTILTGASIKVKVARCKKREDERFAIEGRLIDATRAFRDEIAASVAR